MTPADRPPGALTSDAGGLVGARAVVLGTGAHTGDWGLPDVAAVPDTVRDLAEILVRRCGMDPAAVRTVLDAASVVEFGEAVTATAEAAPAGSPLLVYYVGHGLVSPGGGLYLAAAGTDRRFNRVEYTALPYATLRRCLLDCAARPLMVILDCCFSGRALDGLADAEEEVANLAAIDGAFVMVSAGREELALAPRGDRHTAFSGALLRLLVDGDRDGPARLTLHAAYRYLARMLPAAGFPRPRQRATGGAGDLVLTTNPAYRPPAGAASGVRTPGVVRAATDVCPYKGLAPFEAGDARWFFGRERLTSTVVARLAGRYDDPRPMVVTGSSGSGKSSLLRAGLIPAVARGELGVAGSASWPRVVLTPTADPIGCLAGQAAALTGGSADAVATAMRVGPSSLAAVLREALAQRATGRDPTGARVVIVVDQFEEVFTECGVESERQVFIDALSAVAGGTDDAAALVVIGVRADFYGRCAGYPQLTPALEGQQVVVGPMTVGELRAAIERPAQMAGLSMEPGLVELLLAELGAEVDSGEVQAGSGPVAYEPGRLPLLSHALLASWQQRQDGVLTITSYRRAGGIYGALAATADRVLASVNDRAGQTARSLLLRLVHLGDENLVTRRRVNRSRLLAELPDPEQAGIVLDAFAAEDSRIITIDDDAVQFTHEALLRAWPTLRAWIDADQAGLLVEQRLIDAAHAWDRDGRAPAGLYRGARLTLARDLAADTFRGSQLGPLARAFLDASTAAELAEQQAGRRRARRRAALTAVLAVLLSLAVIAATVADQQRRNAADQQRAATARALAFQAASLRETQPVTALRLGVAALKIDPGPDTHNSLVDTLSGNRYASTLTGVYSFALAADGRTALAGGKDGTATVWNLSNPIAPRRLATLNGPPGEVDRIALSPDGHTAAVGSHSGHFTVVWDVGDPASPRRTATLTGYLGEGAPAAVSQDGRTVLTGGGVAGPEALWDLSNPATPRRLSTLTAGARNSLRDSAALSQDGHTALTAGGEAVWDLHDPANPRRVAILADSDAVALTPDGRTAITSHWVSGTALMWDLSNPANPRLLATLTPHTGEVHSVAVSPDGRSALTGSGLGTAVWDLTNPAAPRIVAVLAGHPGEVQSVALSHGGAIAVTVGADHTAMIWDLTTPATPRKLATLNAHTQFVHSVAVTPDGHSALTSGNDGTAIMWDLSSPTVPRKLATLNSHPNGPHIVWSVALSRDRRLALTGSDHAAATLWDISNPANPRNLATLANEAGDSNEVRSVAMTPDGRLAVTGAYGGTMTVWDLGKPASPPASPRRLATVAHLGDTVHSVALSENGRTAVAGADRTAIVWNLSDPANPRTLATLFNDSADLNADIYSVALTPDGRTALTGSADRTATVWDLSRPTQPRRVATLADHAGPVYSTAISQDGHTAVTAADTTFVWDLSNPATPRLMHTLTNGARPVALTPDGHTMLAGIDNTTTVWDTAHLTKIISNPAGEACAIAERGLNKQEWLRYVPGLPYHDTCSR